MKIAFISYDDSKDINAWSGITKTVFEHLSKKNDVKSIDNLQSPIDFIFKVKSKLLQLLGYTSDYRRNKLFIALVCKRIQKRLQNLDFDIIFAPGTLYVTNLSSNKPIVIWADATFKSLIDSYPQYSNLPKSQIVEGSNIEKVALVNCTKLIFSSKWSAKSAIKDYQLSEDKIEIVPFGANLHHKNTTKEIELIIGQKSKSEINLLFIGIDWYKKGGDILLSIFDELSKLSDSYRLNVVGSQPEKLPQNDAIIFHGFLDKSIESEKQKLEHLFQSSHYFILPTRAEAFGIVFCEANSYGLPTFGSNLGGVPDIIKDGINGELIDIEKSPKELAQQIHNYISTGSYEEKSLLAFNHYQENFTWDKSIEKVNRILEDVVQE